MTSRAARRLLALALAFVLALAGCSSSDFGDDSGDGTGDGGGSAGGAGSANQVSALGVSFEAPPDWKQIDPAATDVDDPVVKDLAKGLGTTPEQFAENMKSVDVFLVDDNGPQNGFLANVNLLDQPGELPPDDQFEQQFAALGADVRNLSHEESEVGSVVAVSYTLPLQGRTIEGVSYLFGHDDKVLTITVSTLDRATSDDIGATIVDSLAPQS